MGHLYLQSIYPQDVYYMILCNPTICTAIGNLGHCLNQDCATITIRLTQFGVMRWHL